MQKNSRILGKVLQGNQSIGLKAGAMFMIIDTKTFLHFAPEYRKYRSRAISIGLTAGARCS